MIVKQICIFSHNLRIEIGEWEVIVECWLCQLFEWDIKLSNITFVDVLCTMIFKANIIICFERGSIMQLEFHGSL